MLAQLPGHPVVACREQSGPRQDKTALLPFLQTLSHAFPFAAIVPLSAKTGQQIGDCWTSSAIDAGRSALYGEDEITDRSERFLAAELLREKLFRLLGAEVPYATAVEIERFETEGEMRRIQAAILVDKPGQKAIVIGQGGGKLKTSRPRPARTWRSCSAARCFWKCG